jgi:hypothetical protein
VTLAVPIVDAVNVEVHVADAVLDAPRVQVVKVPVTPVCDKLTTPVGVTKVPDPVSVTVTLQVEPWLTTTGLVQLIVVDVDRSGIVVIEMIDMPLLETCEVSPGYEAVIWSCRGADPVGV